MEKANTKVALEKNETARREITGVKADTITATNAGDGLVSSKTQVIFWFLLFFKFSTSDGNTACKANGSRAKTGRDWTRQFDDEKRQNDICLGKCLAGCPIV